MAVYEIYQATHNSCVNGSIGIGWAASSTATSYTLLESVNGGGWSTLTSTSSRSYTRSSRANGSYKYQIRACNASGCSGWRVSGSVTVLLPPPVPGSISVPTSTVTNGSIGIGWAASSTATSYTLQESVNGGSWTTRYTFSSTSVQLYERVNGSYKYQVRACNASGCSGWRNSDAVAVQLLPPTDTVSHTLGQEDAMGSRMLSWPAVANTSYYRILVRDSNGIEQIFMTSDTSFLLSLPMGNYSISVQSCNFANMCSTGYRVGSYSPTTTVRYQHTDMLGSPIMETDASGNVISRSVYEPFGKRIGGDKEGIGYTGHLQDKDLGLTYMQARYYDPLIGRFYSNDPVDAMGHIARGNPIHGFNRYTYANNNPYKYVDPDGEFGIVGALIGAAIDAGTQIATSMASGQSLSDAAGNLDYGSIATSAALGAVGGHATQLLKGAATGSMKVGKTTVEMTSKVERTVAGADGAMKAGAVGAIESGRKGEDPVKGAGIKVVDSVTSPVPVGTIVDKGLDYMNNSSQDTPQQETRKEEQN